ncbi:MAG: hypothetical protein PHN44_08015 [Candidatus Marinimicrobia bacterium]|nr:hypothetical protein [Candidatus Neomarinimicrobiota bacterium]MDD5541032.1 hypothetical protein [Candidatus Neomarinimicrobiota bacterium]
MAAPNANKTFWGFVFYLTRNPFKSSGMTRDDILNMAEKYAVANSDAITDYEASGVFRIADAAFMADSGAFTDVEWPDKDGGAGTTAAVGILATGLDSPSIDSAWYPEQHQT